MKTKVCTKCHKEKPLHNFHKDKNGRYGTTIWCKECCKNNYQNNKQKILKQIKDRHKKYQWKFTLLDIKQRCNNINFKQYKNYGGRGIKNKFNNADEIKFLWFRDKAYLMKKPSIDRIDNDGNYCLENCRFIELSLNVKNQNKKHLFKPILQYDLTGNFIKEWENITQAAIAVNGCHQNIVKCAQNKRKTANSFIWKYKEN
jgi:hypothetical protein